MLALIFCGEFLLHVNAGFFLSFFFLFFYFFISGVSLTHPMLALFLSRKFLLHILYLLYFSLGSFSYASYAGF